MKRLSEAFDHALQIDPNLAYARAQLGSIFIKLKKYQQGIEELNRAFRMKPKLAEEGDYQESACPCLE